jgi:hypothetical protein
LVLAVDARDRAADTVDDTFHLRSPLEKKRIPEVETGVLEVTYGRKEGRGLLLLLLLLGVGRRREEEKEREQCLYRRCEGSPLSHAQQ